MSETESSVLDSIVSNETEQHIDEITASVQSNELMETVLNPDLMSYFSNHIGALLQ